MTLDYFEEEEELLGPRPTTTTVNSATKVADTAPHVVEPENTNPLGVNSNTNETMAGHPSIASHSTGTERSIDRAESHGGVQSTATSATDPNSGDASEVMKLLDAMLDPY
jgi:hypothetical protein